MKTMKIKTKRSARKAFWGLIDQAYEIAIEDIERRARAIMKRHPRCKSFCMGMGSACFYDGAGEPIGEDWGPFDYPKYLREFDRALGEYNLINVTGVPMRIKGHDGFLQKEW